MSTKLKLYLGRKVIDSLSKSTKFTPIELLPLIHVGNTTLNNTFELHLPLSTLEDHFGVPNVNEILKIRPDDIIKNIETKKDRANRKISFEIDRTIFIQDVIENSPNPDLNLKPRNIVVEFSSPNIAKPFHMGHLRSTIIGNFIGNLNSFLNNKVTKLNYLGDWGTQFGFIKVGVDELQHTQEAIKNNPLKLLYESYVHANKLAEKDPTVADRARQEFNKLEKGAPEGLEYWNEYMQYSQNELEATYKRLGVVFDEYNFESNYSAKDIQNVIDILSSKHIVQKEGDGKLSVDVNKRKVSIMKSDGSTLYLTRDIAAAIDRYNRYSFDKMLYIVDNSQSDHFNNLKAILHKMSLPWAHKLQHVKFGRIRGMSTRKGTAVFLRDILDECRELMIKKQVESPNTRVPIEDSAVSDILGVSCVIVNDLKQRRQKDYEFTWDSVLQVQGDTGVKLQYTHCRLYSLERNSGATRPKKVIPEVLKEPEATALVREIARFHEILNRSNEQLEACILVTYLFRLCNQINKALKVLPVKNTDPEIASQRLLLFITARQVLGKGMSILGLHPLDEM
ncbi:probable arginine--tRNA ligase, mitochondrial [Tribolium castaneum]|uniref:probable arginine--tRNA ligase, mitochondrial n=1 Tax=Tribolium castaneum TaxID=7070 RepID=UPI0030FE7AC5